MSRLLALAVGLLMALCSASAHAQPVNISVIVEAGTMKYHETIANEYMKRHPDVKIVFRSPVSDYVELVRQTLLDAQANNLPDVGFYGNFTLLTLVERGVAQPLDELIAGEPNWKDLGYGESVLSIGKLEGKQFGIPFAISLPVIYYNADLVTKAGGNAEQLPEDWDGILALAGRIDALGPEVAGMYVRMEDAYIWQCMVLGAGGQLISAEGKSAPFDDAVGQAAVDLMARFGSEGKMPEITWPQSRQQFSAGQVGILVGTSSILEGLKRNAGNSFEIKVRPFPGLNEASKLPAGGNTGVIFSTDPQKRAAAWDYLKFATGPVGQTIMVKVAGYMPVNTVPVQDPELLGKFYQENPAHLVAIGEAKYSTKWFAYPGENGLRIDELIVTRLLDVIHQRSRPREALTALVAEIDKLL